MAISYPTFVPNCVLKGSLHVEPVNTVLESNIEGAPNTRNRYSSELYKVSWQIRMSYTEVNILLNWYYNSVKKILGFNFIDPITGLEKDYYFVQPPSYSHIGGEHFIVNFNLETSP